MKRPTNWLLAAFFSVALLNLLAENLDSRVLIFATKPLLLPLLAAWFWQETGPATAVFSRRLWLAGMLFSWLGDVLLMFQETGSEPLFFMLGLGSFLVAQLFYAAAFIHFPTGGASFLWKNWWILLPFVLFLVGFLKFLWPGLPAEMKLPVSFYGVAILTMAVSSLTFLGKTDRLTAWTVFAGALIFVKSDCLLAVNKFSQPFGHAREAVMLSYLIGQFLIAFGAVRALKKRPHSAA